jgi:hypothetical protein
MGQSLKARFNGKSQEVLDYARRFDIWKAMEQYEVKDYVAMLKFLETLAPGEKFDAPREDYDSATGPGAFDHLVAATQRYIAKLETQRSALVAENARLKEEVEDLKKENWNKRKQSIRSLELQISKDQIDF